MWEKLAQIELQFDKINEALSATDLYSDPDEAARLLKEQKSLAPVVEAYRAVMFLEKRAAEAEKMLDDADPDIREMAQEEILSCREEKKRRENELRILLLPKDQDDEKSVILEIRGGVGGEEATLFAADLFRMYSMYAANHGYTVEITNVNETELAGIKEISFIVEGRGAWSRLKFEGGAHRVQRVPETENQGRIHTSAVTVAVLPAVEDVEVEINPADIQVDTFRSSGAGGQHVNKTESAIRLTHIPTGIVVECQDERSQYKNKDKAMKVLKSKLYKLERDKQARQREAARREQVGSGDRSERIRTYNFPQNRVTDHRIGLTIYKLNQFMNGDLDEMIDALVTAEQAEKLKNAEI